jgi:DNA polymerase III sliding clamp (beta) subunit (PCNA family)
MLDITIEARHVKRIVNVLRHVADEAIVEIDPSGISIALVDCSNAHAAYIHVPAEQCGTFDATPHKIGVDIINVWNKIKSVKVADTVRLTEDGLETPVRLLIEIKNSTYGIALLDMNYMRTPPPKPDVDLIGVAAGIDGRVIKQLVKDAKSVSDYIDLGIDSDTFTATASDRDSYTLKLENAAVGFGKSKFSLDYLSSVAAGIDDKDIVDVLLGEDVPMKIAFAVDRCDIVEWLAPKVEA